MTKNNIKNVIWECFFALMYPALILFSLIFTGIVKIFSGLSGLLVYILSKREDKE